MGLVSEMKEYVRQKGRVTGGDLLKQYGHIGYRASHIILTAMLLERAGQIATGERGGKRYFRMPEDPD